MSALSSEWVLVRIKGLLPTPGGAGIFLEAEDKIISIFIDPMVGRALSLGIAGEQAPRPLTHDLMLSVFAGLGIQVKQVRIPHCEDGTYYAVLCLEQENELGKSVVEVDARPSDCLVLAARCSAPVYVARSVWDAEEGVRFDE